MKDQVVIFWFRRDLRLEDNCALHHALAAGYKVLPIFIFDTAILSQLEDRYDRRVDYIHQVVTQLDQRLRAMGSGLCSFVGTPVAVFQQLMAKYRVEGVYCNHDYEPAAISRDDKVAEYLREQGIGFSTYKDQVIFEKNEVVKDDGLPYTVFTPYAKRWKAKLREDDYKAYTFSPQELYRIDAYTIPALADIGFKDTDVVYAEPVLDQSIIDNYHLYRDYPALERTTALGIALRFGTISIRACVALAVRANETWLNELIWREFFMQVLYHFPKVVTHCFKVKYENIVWQNKETEFLSWCEGRTGYPIVDAGMRQLNQTGFMHNRVRMITASFLTKHLLIDWRWGEAYFAQKLLDYDLSANNGNWQWAAGCGCDAAPYFRIFNPAEQTKKFDKELRYIRKWNPDFEDILNNPPIVEHTFARDRALAAYKKGVS